MSYADNFTLRTIKSLSIVARELKWFIFTKIFSCRFAPSFNFLFNNMNGYLSSSRKWEEISFHWIRHISSRWFSSNYIRNETIKQIIFSGLKIYRFFSTWITWCEQQRHEGNILKRNPSLPIHHFGFISQILCISLFDLSAFCNVMTSSLSPDKWRKLWGWKILTKWERATSKVKTNIVFIGFVMVIICRFH